MAGRTPKRRGPCFRSISSKSRQFFRTREAGSICFGRQGRTSTTRCHDGVTQRLRRRGSIWPRPGAPLTCRRRDRDRSRSTGRSGWIPGRCPPSPRSRAWPAIEERSSAARGCGDDSCAGRRARKCVFEFFGRRSFDRDDGRHEEHQRLLGNRQSGSWPLPETECGRAEHRRTGHAQESARRHGPRHRQGRQAVAKCCGRSRSFGHGFLPRRLGDEVRSTWNRPRAGRPTDRSERNSGDFDTAHHVSWAARTALRRETSSCRRLH